MEYISTIAAPTKKFIGNENLFKVREDNLPESLTWIRTLVKFFRMIRSAKIRLRNDALIDRDFRLALTPKLDVIGSFTGGGAEN